MTDQDASYKAEAMALRDELEHLTFLPAEDVAKAKAAGEFYGHAMEARDYVAEMGDPRSAIHDLMTVHPGHAVDKEDLADHPATQIAKALSDEMNASRISNRRDPVVRAPRSFI